MNGQLTAPAEGLRERKKRLMRQQLSDTATAMFLERGFDAVRVTEVAAACGVSLATTKRRLTRAETRFAELARSEPSLTDWMEGGDER